MNKIKTGLWKLKLDCDPPGPSYYLYSWGLEFFPIMDFTHADRWWNDILAEKYPELSTFSHTFGVEDFIKIHQFNEPASGTCDLMIAFESDRQTRVSDLIRFSLITYFERRNKWIRTSKGDVHIHRSTLNQHRVLRIAAVRASTRCSSHYFNVANVKSFDLTPNFSSDTQWRYNIYS